LFIPVEMALGMFYNVASYYHNAVHRESGAAIQFCQCGLALAVSIESMQWKSQALHQLARIKLASGDFSGAQESASESQRAAKIAGNLYIEASALHLEAYCWQHRGSYSYCLSLLYRAKHLLDLCGMSSGALHSSITTNQAEVHRCKSEYVEARNIQIHLLHDTPVDQDTYYHALALINIAQIDVEIGGFKDSVQQNIRTAAILFQRINYSVGLTWCDLFRAAVDVQQHDFSAGQSRFQKCLRHTWGKDSETLLYCLEKLGDVEQWCPTDKILFPWPVTLLVYSFRCKLRLQLHKALQFLGDVFWAQGDQDTASSLFTVALEGFSQMDVHRSRAECMVRLGDISKLTGDEPKAAKLWERARPLFERSSQRKQLADLDAKLVTLRHSQSEEVQQDNLNHLSKIYALSEQLEQFSMAGGPNSKGIEG
jgi:tetratricopeptide (TPR) repeat protein